MAKQSSETSTLVKEFLSEFGKLLSIRISRYLEKYFDNNEFDFFNQFVICPSEENLDPDYMDKPAQARSHFEKNLKIEFVKLEIEVLELTKDCKIQYTFDFYPDFLDDLREEEFGDFCGFSLVGSELEFLNTDFLNALELIDESSLRSLIGDIQGEISFGTLKNS
jgi:hypothetical protein